MEFGLSRCKSFLRVKLAVFLVDAIGGGGWGAWPSTEIITNGQFRNDSLQHNPVLGVGRMGKRVQ